VILHLTISHFYITLYQILVSRFCPLWHVIHWWPNGRRLYR